MADTKEAKQYFALKTFKTINTQPSRTALDEGEFSWLENLMPIGDGYMPAVPAIGSAIATIAQTISTMHFCNIGTVNYMIQFCTDGSAYAVNMNVTSTVTIAAASTFSSPTMDQWKSERALIIDPTKGYFSWDGTLFFQPGSLATISVTVAGSGYTSIPAIGFTGGGGSGATATATLSGGGVSAITITAVGSGFTAAPTVTFTGGGGTGSTASAYIMPAGQVGSAVSVYSGRAWLSNGRVITYTAPNTWVDFGSANAAGSTTLTEGFLRQSIQATEALNNYLYIFGDSSIYIIGDLKVSAGITTFSLTNLSSTTGTTLPYTVTAMERAILFMNQYGVYALFGASVQKVSKQLDGIFPNIDFTKPVSGGLVELYNILCYVVSFQYGAANPGGASGRQIQAVFFDGKWFLTSQESALSFIAPAEISGTLSLYGMHGTHFHPLYSDTTSSISTTLQTGLNPFDSPIFEKQLMRAGVESTCPQQATVNVELDTENTSQTLQASFSNAITWSNNSASFVSWTNNSSVVVVWITTGFVTYSNYYDLVGNYIGFTLTSTTPQLVYNGLLGEYVKRAPWGGR